MRGPIDYIIVGFEGNQFKGDILRAIAEAIDKGIIGLVALTLIVKDGEGNVKKISLSDTGDTYALEFEQKYQGDPSLIDNDDIDEVADLLENNTSAGLLAIEQLWAIPLKKAIVDAKGVLVAEGRIHPDAAAELNNKKGE